MPVINALSRRTFLRGMGLSGAMIRIGVPALEAMFSPNGTILDIRISDLNTGKLITTFPAPVTLTLKFNAADVGQSGRQCADPRAEGQYGVRVHLPALT